MELFEKQQTIEPIKTIIKARWFYVLIIAAQGLTIKLIFPFAPLPSSSLIFFIVLTILLINFGFWLYLRRPPEKISVPALKIIKFSQVLIEQLGLSAILYFSGTSNKMLLMLYIIPIMVGSSLFKAKGIALATFSTMLLYSGLVILEYFGLMPYVSPESDSYLPGKVLRGNLTLVKGQLVGFNLYILSAAFYASYLSNLFKRREQYLVSQRNDLVQKTELLTLQTRELTQTKDWLHEALTKSDKARLELGKTKQELEKANLELKAKIDELEKYSRVTVGRELKMTELKSDIKTLRETVKQLQDRLESLETNK